MTCHVENPGVSLFDHSNDPGSTSKTMTNSDFML